VSLVRLIRKSAGCLISCRTAFVCVAVLSILLARSAPPSFPNGVLVHVSSRPGSECRGEVDGNDRLQPSWVCSSDACGIYDIPGVTLIRAGRVNLVGQITLASERGKIHIRAGTGLLLRVK
jgi:hypothetical protein